MGVRRPELWCTCGVCGAEGRPEVGVDGALAGRSDGLGTPGGDLLRPDRSACAATLLIEGALSRRSAVASAVRSPHPAQEVRLHHPSIPFRSLRRHAASAGTQPWRARRNRSLHSLGGHAASTASAALAGTQASLHATHPRHALARKPRADPVQRVRHNGRETAGEPARSDRRPQAAGAAVAGGEGAGCRLRAAWALSTATTAAAAAILTAVSTAAAAAEEALGSSVRRELDTGIDNPQRHGSHVAPASGEACGRRTGVWTRAGDAQDLFLSRLFWYSEFPCDSDHTQLTLCAQPARSQQQASSRTSTRNQVPHAKEWRAGQATVTHLHSVRKPSSCSSCRPACTIPVYKPRDVPSRRLRTGSTCSWNLHGEHERGRTVHEGEERDSRAERRKLTPQCGHSGCEARQQPVCANDNSEGWMHKTSCHVLEAHLILITSNGATASRENAAGQKAEYPGTGYAVKERRAHGGTLQPSVPDLADQPPANAPARLSPRELSCGPSVEWRMLAIATIDGKNTPHERFQRKRSLELRSSARPL